MQIYSTAGLQQLLSFWHAAGWTRKTLQLVKQPDRLYFTPGLQAILGKDHL